MLEPWELDENWAGTIDENDLRRWMSKAPVVRMTHRKISVLVLIGFLQEIDVIPLPAKGILHSKTHGEFRGRSFALATYQHALCKLWTKWKPSGLCDEPTVTNLSSHLPGHQGDGWVARSFCNWPSLVCSWFAYSSYILHIFFIIFHYYSLLFIIIMIILTFRYFWCLGVREISNWHMGSRSGTTNTATTRWPASVSMASALIASRWNAKMVRSSMWSGDTGSNP